MKTRMKLLIAFLSIGLCFQSCSKDNFGDVVLSQNENEEPIAEDITSGTVTIDDFLKDPHYNFYWEGIDPSRSFGCDAC